MLIHVVVQKHNRLLCILFFSQKKIADNTQELAGVTRDLYKLSIERRNLKILVGDGSSDLPSKRQKGAVDLQNSNGTGSGNNICSSQENGYASSDLRSSIVLKIAVCPIKLPKLEKLPPYTTWVFLHRCVMRCFFCVSI